MADKNGEKVETTDGTSLEHDTTRPIATYVHITTDNANTSFGINNNVVTVKLTIDEPVLGSVDSRSESYYYYRHEWI